MRTLPDDEKRLSLLNEAQPDRPWLSCAEKRRCVACERVFRGSALIARSLRRLENRLACPKCGSGPALWVRLGNPYTDDRVWAEWECALTHAAADPEDDLAAVE